MVKKTFAKGGEDVLFFGGSGKEISFNFGLKKIGKIVRVDDNVVIGKIDAAGNFKHFFDSRKIEGEDIIGSFFLSFFHEPDKCSSGSGEVRFVVKIGCIPGTMFKGCLNGVWGRDVIGNLTIGNVNVLKAIGKVAFVDIKDGVGAGKAAVGADFSIVLKEDEVVNWFFEAEEVIEMGKESLVFFGDEKRISANKVKTGQDSGT